MQNSLLNRTPKKVTFKQKPRAGESERTGEKSVRRGPGIGSYVMWPRRPLWLEWSTCVY